jgi:O-succinylbenzoic acid--CoA ligase
MEFIPFFVGGIADAVFGRKLVLVIEGEKQLLDEHIYSSLDKYQSQRSFYIDKFIDRKRKKKRKKEMLESI